jgi:lipooligosaccharide transport system permease protein
LAPSAGGWFVDVSASVTRSGLLVRVIPPAFLGRGRARRLVERNVMVYRRGWLIIVSGFFEPFFYLLSIGVGIGKLVGDVTGPGGTSLSYSAFVAPALLASSAMNGAIYDSTLNVYFKLKFAHTYDAILATPVGVGDVALGEITWALIRGLLYSAVFIVVMAILGDISSPWAILALPAAVLIGFGFAAVGMAATTFMRSWNDFDFVQLAILPLFLFSTTFFPLSTYPRWLQIVVECTPLYHGVSLERGLCTGAVSPALLGHALYLAVMGVAGLMVTVRRLAILLLH